MWKMKEKCSTHSKTWNEQKITAKLCWIKIPRNETNHTTKNGKEREILYLIDVFKVY